jgi:hypothetical protein
VSLAPVAASPSPSYPARRRSTFPSTRRLGAAIAAVAALLSAPARADDDWMLWLEDVGFCPLMDCDPRPPPTRVQSIRLAGVTMSGTLTAATIQRQVRQQSNRVRACYERGLQRKPALSGRVAIRFVIELDGRVGHALVAESTIADPSVEACVREVVSSLTFPTGDDGWRYVVTYPFWFQRRQHARP